MSDKIKYEIENKDSNLERYYPDHKLQGRGRLAYEWLPKSTEKLLDAGCSYGYVTVHLAKKAQKTYGVDIDTLHIDAARNKYPDIEFHSCSLENLPFEDEFFNAIVILDVLEHTEDKIRTLNELHRVLQKDGILIISTPHKGLFGFLDPYNYGYFLRTYLPFLYKMIYKTVKLLKTGKIPKDWNPVHLEKHYHYSKKDFLDMLRNSSFGESFELEKIKRSGLFLEVLYMNLEAFLSVLLPKKVLSIILKPFEWLGMLDNKISYGPSAYNIAIKIKKKK